jgi:hypothetical protein
MTPLSCSKKKKKDEIIIPNPKTNGLPSPSNNPNPFLCTTTPSKKILTILPPF